MVPPPGTSHQLLAGSLEPVIVPIGKARGLIVIRETGVFSSAAENNYRVPDLVVVDPAHLSSRGVERRAEVVIEILSPRDESREKLPFYAACGAQEVWLIDPKTRVCEVLSLASHYASAGAESIVLGLRFSTAPGPLLRIEWSDGTVEI